MFFDAFVSKSDSPNDTPNVNETQMEPQGGVLASNGARVPAQPASASQHVESVPVDQFVPASDVCRLPCILHWKLIPRAETRLTGFPRNLFVVRCFLICCLSPACAWPVTISQLIQANLLKEISWFAFASIWSVVSLKLRVSLLPGLRLSWSAAI